MIAFPNAKINLGLNIIEKRPDCFHNIESVFVPVDLCDVLEIVGSAGRHKVNFSRSGLEIPADGNENLCIRAFRLLDEDYKLSSVSIHLHKLIPVGAGLGGGSSDGAAAIRLLNDLFSLGISEDRQLEYARKLGSDCAFFILNRPVFAIEKGDRFEDIKLNLSKYHIAIVFPGLHISTTDAYSGIIPVKPHRSVKQLIRQPAETWKDCLQNDFERIIFNKYPEIRETKEKLYAKGAVYASMSGSGSAVYGIFAEKPDLKEFDDNWPVHAGRIIRS
ncbi:MAG: 4-(cytidine 5'-diphospho)-2-C-methyl-D-erythritol kinase [Bacteroidetes bacterium]|nr:4-(cytidine 5'-diphospho)-2-C-methyl-D-erythritol kinase [Bacteroidota bacterium]